MTVCMVILFVKATKMKVVDNNIICDAIRLNVFEKLRSVQCAFC